MTRRAAYELQGVKMIQETKVNEMQDLHVAPPPEAEIVNDHPILIAEDVGRLIAECWDIDPIHVRLVIDELRDCGWLDSDIGRPVTARDAARIVLALMTADRVVDVNASLQVFDELPMQAACFASREPEHPGAVIVTKSFGVPPADIKPAEGAGAVWQKARHGLTDAITALIESARDGVPYIGRATMRTRRSIQNPSFELPTFGLVFRGDVGVLLVFNPPTCVPGPSLGGFSVTAEGDSGIITALGALFRGAAGDSKPAQ
jgi:hypothetical protein